MQQRPSLTPTVQYSIRKLLRLNLPRLQSVVVPGAALSADSFNNLDDVLESLYLEPSEISRVVLELEKLMLIHDRLSSQRQLYPLDLQSLETRIYWLLGYKYCIEPQRGKILIVDDQIEMLQLLGRGLKKQGYVIHTLSKGQDVMSITHAFRPDLIMLDLLMPETNGYEVCQRLKTMDYSRNIPVVFVSAVQDPRVQTQLKAMGIAGYITKPFQLQDVLTLIEQLLEKDSSSPQRMGPLRIEN